jgi:alpha-D-xyloside xylohydrolase
MHPLFYDFPDDGTSYTIEDQYMFGPDILVAPVLEAGAGSRMIYFPEGSMWKDALTGETYEGAQTIDYAVSIKNIPLFTRNGFDFEVE